MHRESLRFVAWDQLFRTLVFVVFLSQIACGCVTDGGGENKGRLSLGLSGSGTVDSIRLFTSSSVLNFDNKPGIDGFTARVYAIQQDRPKPIKINSGEIEFLVYESTIEDDPLQAWKFDSNKLKRHMGESQIGVVYDFRLRWDASKAPKRKAAILAQYRSADGKLIQAVPVVLPISP